MNIKDILNKEILVFDGALGTSLQAEGLRGEQLSEEFNFENPETVKKIYREYIKAGSRVLSTNTFSSNMHKLTGKKFDDKQSIKKAIEITKQAIKEYESESEQNSDDKILIAHDIGPIGELMEPVGDLDFDMAYDLFRRQIIAGKEGGANLHFFETFSDIIELRTGVIAAKENSDLPVICSITVNQDGRMLLGTEPETAVYILQDMGIDAIGINCSLGPAELIPIVKKMTAVSKLPILVQPNAGMPRVSGEKTFYDVTPEEFTECMMEMIDAGAAAVGGCCGTTGDFIDLLTHKIGKRNKSDFLGLSSLWYESKNKKAVATACTANKTVKLDRETVIIGERINPTGRKDLKKALKDREYSFVESDAVNQQNFGAHIININVGMEGIDEVKTMEDLSSIISKTIEVPVQIDSSNPDALESGVRKYPGKPIVNSVNGEQQSMDRVFPIVKKYGTAVIALTLDENGIPKTTEERLTILDKIIDEASKYNITKDRIIVDTLALTVSTDPLAAKKTLKAIERISNDYKMSTVLGASNISFGLPNRDLVNRTFLSMAIYAGISSVITDPTKTDYMDEIKSAEVLSGRDEFAKKYICYNEQTSGENSEKKGDTQNGRKGNDGLSASNKAKTDKNQITDDKGKMSLTQIIMDGRENMAEEATKSLLKHKAPLEIVNEIVVPSLEIIGNDYEEGISFLPQMIKSAETVKRTFDVLKPIIAGEGNSISKGKIIVATVKGDIHDIGKNIVKTVLENYGYDIIDLGKDIGTDEIIKAAKAENVKFIGLSALMTTTMVNMKTTIDAVKKEGMDCMVAVGGAVLTQEYADRIEADFYCETAMDTVRAAEQIFSNSNL